MATSEALRIARERELDLVEVAPNATPPVCKIMDYGHYKYEMAKKDKEARKKQRSIAFKEIRLRPKIDDHDFQVKRKAIQRFLADGDKVKVTVMFRGRELAHPDLGRGLLTQMAEELKEYSVVERMPLLEGRNMTMVLTPIQPKTKEQPIAQAEKS